MAKAIFINEAGRVSVMNASPEALETMTLLEIAKKDVPAGLPFKIVEDAEVPQDRASRDAWIVDPETLTDGIGEFLPDVSIRSV